jgi:hypothetical protein
MNFKDAMRVKGLSLNDKVGIFGGVDDPTTMDTSSWPTGSVYFQSNGTAWRKSGDGTGASSMARMVAEEMMLLNLGLAMGKDGNAHPLSLSGFKDLELMVHDTHIVDLLSQILAEQKITNFYLSLVTGEQAGHESILGD